MLDRGVAEEQLDKFQHIKCQYLEKGKEQVTYKLLDEIVYVIPTQVMSPSVLLNEKNELSIEAYQWS